MRSMSSLIPHATPLGQPRRRVKLGAVSSRSVKSGPFRRCTVRVRHASESWQNASKLNRCSSYPSHPAHLWLPSVISGAWPDVTVNAWFSLILPDIPKNTIVQKSCRVTGAIYSPKSHLSQLNPFNLALRPHHLVSLQKLLLSSIPACIVSCWP